MNVPKITTIGSPQNISFRKFEHSEELFKKLPPDQTKAGENRENGRKYFTGIRTVYRNSGDVPRTK